MCLRCAVLVQLLPAKLAASLFTLKRRLDDSPVELVRMLVGKILLHRHPATLGNLKRIKLDLMIQRLQA